MIRIINCKTSRNWVLFFKYSLRKGRVRNVNFRGSSLLDIFYSVYAKA